MLTNKDKAEENPKDAIAKNSTACYEKLGDFNEKVIYIGMMIKVLYSQTSVI